MYTTYPVKLNVVCLFLNHLVLVHNVNFFSSDKILHCTVYLSNIYLVNSVNFCHFLDSDASFLFLVQILKCFIIFTTFEYENTHA
jgi:hypothetical protein